MTDLRWRFRRMQPAELNQDPMEREFFSGEPINERLVREAVQNSLDAGLARAGRGAGPVRVRFSLKGVHSPLSRIDAAPYVEELEEHLVAGLDRDDWFCRQAGLRGLLPAQGMSFLVIEDTGTVGLEGDWARYDDDESNRADNEHFYWFFRNIGRSGKRDQDAGSWGLGKWVFPDASNASAFIAITRRSFDGETLLMGQCVLKKHHVDGERYAPYGYFAEETADGLPVPLRSSEPSHRDLIEQCIADFDLRYRNQSGLSIIIPFPKVESDGISKEQVLAAVVHNYFYPILQERLIVAVDDGHDEQEISADAIDEITANLPLDASGERSSESYRRLFAMCRESDTADLIELSSPPINRQDYRDRAKVSDLNGRFERGDLLAFRVRTSVQRRDAEHGQGTSFRLYVQKDGALSRGHDYYVRGPLTIPGEDHLGSRSARTLLIVDENEPLAFMLRDSEPPAHNQWRPRDERAAKRWVGPDRRIKRVRESPANLLSIWESAPVGLDKDALADIFPVGAGAGPGRRKPDGDGRGKIWPPPPPPPPSHRAFDVNQTRDGFSVRAAKDEDAPQRVRLRAAYDVPRGNAFSAYNVNDFRLHGDGALAVEWHGCDVSPGENENELLLAVTNRERFSVAVQGFDPHRDVIIDVQELADPNSADSES